MAGANFPAEYCVRASSSSRVSISSSKVAWKVASQAWTGIASVSSSSKPACWMASLGFWDSSCRLNFGGLRKLSVPYLGCDIFGILESLLPGMLLEN